MNRKNASEECNAFLIENKDKTCGFLHGESIEGTSYLTMGGTYADIIGMTSSIMVQLSDRYKIPPDRVVNDILRCADYITKNNTMRDTTISEGHGTLS